MSSQYGNNEAGENICVEKIMALSADWTEEQITNNLSFCPTAILRKWAESHSDEYDQPYYSIIMTPAICACLREYTMMEKVREKRYSDARFKKAQLASWRNERERCANILNNEFCSTDGAKVMFSKLSKLHARCVELRNDDTVDYQAFRNSNALLSFDELIRYVNRAHSTKVRLEIREKKANLEKQRVEFLNNRLEMEFYKYAVNS